MASACLLCGARGARFSAGGKARWCDRDHFAAWDRHAEAEEAAEVGGVRFAPDELATAIEPTYRKALPKVTRIGSRTVIGVIWRVRADGRARRYFRVRCDCGQYSVVASSEFIVRRAACRSCAARAAAQPRAMKVGGASLRELAARAGVSTVAIRQRIRLGWSEDELAAPARGHRRAA